jgi:hypothetical protein
MYRPCSGRILLRFDQTHHFEEELVKRIKRKVYGDEATLCDALDKPFLPGVGRHANEQKVGAKPCKIMIEIGITYFSEWRNNMLRFRS